MIKQKFLSIFLILLACSLLLSSPVWAQTLRTEDVQLSVIQQGRQWKLTNGNIEIILVQENSIRDLNSKRFLSPIQSLVYRGGQLSDDTPNFLVAESQPVDAKARVLKNAKEECVIEYVYRFSKPQFYYGKKTFKGGEPGPGFYKSTIRLRRGARSVMIEEEADFDISYTVKISNGLNPDKARYRGWAAVSKTEGYEPTGGVYRSEQERGYPMDATVDLNFSKSVQYPRLSLWEPAGGEYNSGRYWLVYNSRSPGGTIVGFFQGRPSRLYAAKEVGPRLLSQPSDEKPAIGNEKVLSIQVSISRLAPDQSFAKRRRFEWGIFIGNQSDLLSPELTQPIAVEMSRQAGLGAKISSYATGIGKLVPAFYKGALYLPEQKIQKLIERVKSEKDFYEKLCLLDGAYKPVFDAWRYPDSAKSLLKNILKWYNRLQEEYTRGEGVYAWDLRYWKGALNFKQYSLMSSCLFADKSIPITKEEKLAIEKMQLLMARIVWDNDNAPMFDSSGVNFGPENMVYMYQNNARYFFALIFANDPEFSQRAKSILQKIKTDINNAIYSNGSSFGNPHYIQATMDPLLFTMLQLKRAGVADLFTGNKRIYLFIDFYKSLLTPPSVRFSGYRKLISFGDGSEESAVTFALLASGLESSDSKTSEELYYIFENGATRSTIYGAISLTIDITRTHKANPQFGNSNYFGYLSHFRYNANTELETSCWILNGDSLYDHRNDDAGEISIYALGAPLSLGRSSFYYPAATDARIKSVVVPFSIFPEWNGPAQPIAERSLTNRTWPASQQISFASLGKTGFSESKMTGRERDWFRNIAIINVRPECPLIFIYDSFDLATPFIWSMFFSSAGRIKAPKGEIETAPRVYNNQKKELPSASKTFLTTAQSWNSFYFVGQLWNKKYHVSGGIDWHLFQYSNTPSEYAAAQWTTTWQNDAEAKEFYNTNNRAYSDDQQILRTKSSSPLLTVIAPFNKGRNLYAQPPRELRPGLHLLVCKEDSILFNRHGYYWRTGKKIYAALFGSDSFESNNISIAGGAAEVEIDQDTVRIRVHGKAGKRRVQLPFKQLIPFFKNQPIKAIEKSGYTEIMIDYRTENTNLLSTEPGYSEWTWKLKN